MTKKKPITELKVQTSVPMPFSLVEELDQVCAAEGVTRSEKIRALVRDGLLRRLQVLSETNG